MTIYRIFHYIIHLGLLEQYNKVFQISHPIYYLDHIVYLYQNQRL